MLSVFPTLLFSTYSLVVPLVFRIVIGLVFVWLGYRKITGDRNGQTNVSADLKPAMSPSWTWLVAVVEMVGGILLLIGLYTQVVALIFSIMLIPAIIGKYKKPEMISLSRGTLLLLLLVTASLLFLGPGFYAFDLPL